MTNTAWKVVAVLALLVLLLPTAVIGADSLSVPYATHTLNITFSATTGWPTTTEALQPTATAVQTLICGDELSTALECTAFMTVASTNHVALQVSAQSSKVGDSYTIFRTMYDWSEGEGSFPLTKLQSVCAAALQTTLSPLTYTMGSYVAPCRFPDEYQFLPACATDEVPRTILRVYESSGDLQKYFTAAICASPVGCGTGSVLVTAPSLLSDYTTVAISSAPFGLEAALQFVADVRAAYYVSVSASPPPVGNPVAGVGASKVMLQTATTVTMLFATNESGAVADPTITCAASTGFWAFAFIGILPVCFVLFRYSYYRGRHTAKKRARAAIESEERQFLAGGFTTAEENPQPGTTVAAATAAPAADVAAANEIYDQQGDGQWVQENGLWYHVPDGSGEAASYPAKDHEDGLVAADEYADDAANYMQPEGDDGQQYAQDYAEQEGDYPADQAEQDYSAAQEAGQEYAADQAYEQPNEDEAYYAPQAEEHAQDEEGQYVDPEDIVRSDLVADRPLDGPN